MDLKPCPFCGGEPEQHCSPRWQYTICCHKCDIKFAHMDRYEVAKLWNKRQESSSAEAKLRKLLDGLDSLGILLVNSGYDDEVVEAISEYIESLRREVKSA